jgi:hypothetical protein
MTASLQGRGLTSQRTSANSGPMNPRAQAGPPG